MSRQNIPHLSPVNLYLNSHDAQQIGAYGNHSIFQLRSKIVIPSNVQAYVSLQSFTYSNLFYNIGPTRENTILYFSLSNAISTILSVQIPAGNYNIQSLILKLNELMASYSISFAYNESTFKITATSTGFQFIIRDGDNSIAETLGFVADTVQGLSCTGIKAISLGGVRIVSIQIPSLIIESNGSSLQSSCLDQINNTSILGTIVSYIPNGQTAYYMQQSILNTIEVLLTDERGRDLNFLGSDWSLTLHLSFIYRPEYIQPYNRFPTADQSQQQQQQQTANA